MDQKSTEPLDKVHRLFRPHNTIARDTKSAGGSVAGKPRHLPAHSDLKHP